MKHKIIPALGNISNVFAFTYLIGVFGAKSPATRQ
jgi:hypothetical protein